MSPILKSFGIDLLSVDERILLVHEIWDSIPTESESPLLSEDQRQELQRRLAAYKVAPDEVIPWEQIESDANARCRP